MSNFTLERKLAHPVCCLRCEWIGRTGELMSGRGADHLDPFHCPRCGESDIKWIENEAPNTIQ